MSIFDEKNKLEGKRNYFSFKTIGDKIEGTLVSVRVVPNKLKGGESQNVYELKQANGEFIDVYGKVGIDLQMRNVKLGQIVGFEFVNKIPPTVPGHSATNIVQVYADPEMVDEAWIMQNEENQAGASNGGGQSYFNNAPTPETNTVTPPTTGGTATTEPENEVLKEINNLAVSKLGATTPEEVKSKVMEKTNLAFIEVNLPAILEQLKQLP